MKPLVIALTLALLTTTAAQAQERAVDFGFSPAIHSTAICFPSDWQKTLVSEKGSLSYDLGPGPYARPLTEVAIGIKGTDLAIQRLAITDPRTPIVEAEYTGAGVTVHTTTFALVEGSAPHAKSRFTSGRVTRIGGLNGVAAWARPPAGVDSSFRNVAWGTNRPIVYRVSVPRGSSKKVALGIIEPYKSVTGQRVLELQVEGAGTVTVDAYKDHEKNHPYAFLFDGRDANNDGELSIEVHGSQLALDPNTTLSSFWIFPAGTVVSEADVISGKASSVAEVHWECGAENELNAPSTRIDGILARYDGKDFTPTVTVRTGRTCVFDPGSGILMTDGHPYVATRPAARSATQNGTTWTLELPKGTVESQVFVFNGRGLSVRALRSLDLRTSLKKAKAYWSNEKIIPFGAITVPDPGIQYLLDANIRNFYQISEWVDGSFQFQPGPSVYRGLWMHDGVWDVSAALYLGDTLNARRMIETMLQFQKPDGKVELSEPFPMHRETMVSIYAAVRYATLTGNRAWLKAHWGNVSRGMQYVRKLHMSTLADPSTRYFGLFPPGFADGGLGGMEAEYGTTYWGMISLHAAAAAAKTLGVADSATSWNALADEIMQSFRKTAARDARRDTYGNLYLPMKVGDTSATTLPQMANWGILDGQGIGHLFPYNDPYVNGTLAMLDSTSKEGLAQNVGWLKNGIWAFFGALHGIGHTYQRNYPRAIDLLYAVANHASPLGVWVEEQLPKGEGIRTTGDVSDATGSSLYIKLLRRLLIIERGDTLELLAGVPREWYKPGAVLTFRRTLTEFGPLTLSLRIAKDGKSGSLSVDPLSRGKTFVVRIPLEGLTARGFTLENGSPLPAAILAAGSTATRLRFLRSGS